MPEPKRPLKVFLCHASADKPAVRSLYKRLVADGVDVWLDAESLVAGQNWQVEIPKAIRESDVVVVCLSERSINKEGYVQREIKFALDIAEEKPEGTIFIIPTKLEECKVPERLSVYHWVDLFEESGYKRLIRAFRVRADAIGATLQIKKNRLPISIPRSQIKNNKRYFIWVALVVMVLIASIFALPPLIDQIEETPTMVLTENASISVSVAETSELTEVPIIPSDIEAPLETSTPFLPLLTEITDDKGVSMMLVTEGEFEMGSEYSSDTKPLHSVYLDSFYIDKYEVTNNQYNECVKAEKCQMPEGYFRLGVSPYEQHPVSKVNWSAAKSFCEWRGTRLPTEAEWEKSARGLDGLTYPWIGGFTSCMYANLENCIGTTRPVGSYEIGKSPYGVYDLSGNVWEWVADWYYLNYEGASFENPGGPQNGSLRVIRGGAWDSEAIDGRSFSRDAYYPDATLDNIGFRCAKDAP